MSAMNPYYNPSWAKPYQDGYAQPQSAGADYGGMANSAAAGYSAGQAFGQPQSSFEMSNANVWGGAGAGAASGFASAGPVGGFIGAITGGATAISKQDKALRESANNVNTEFNQSYDAYGKPVYDSQGMAQGQQDFRGLMKATQPGKNAMLPKRRRQLLRKAEDVYYGMQTSQNNYNNAERDFRDQSLARQDYTRRLNDNSRLYNVYNRY
jgi:hypothetical protein